MEKDERLNAVVNLATSPEFCRIKWESVTFCLDEAMIHVHRTSTQTKDVFDFKYHQCFLDKCTHSFCNKENCTFNRTSEESETDSEATRHAVSSEKSSNLPEWYHAVSSENSSSLPEWCPAVHDYLKKVLRPCCSAPDYFQEMKTFKKSVDKQEPPAIVEEVDETGNLQRNPVENVKKEHGSTTNELPTRGSGNGQRELGNNENDTNDKHSDTTYTVGSEMRGGYFNFLNKDLTDFIDINGSKQNDTSNADKIYNLFSGLSNSSRDERIFQEFRRAFSEAVERIQKAETTEDKEDSVPVKQDTFVSVEETKKEEKESGQNDLTDFKYSLNQQDGRVRDATKETDKKNVPKPRKHGKTSHKAVHRVVNSNIDESFLEDCLKHVYIGNPYGSHLKDCYCFDCSKPNENETDHEKAVENPRNKVHPKANDYLNGCRAVSSQACLSKTPLKVNRQNGRKSRKLRKIVTSDKTVDLGIGPLGLSKTRTALFKSLERKKASSEPNKETKSKLPSKIKFEQKKTNEEPIKAKKRLPVNSARSRTSYETCPPILSRESTASTYDPRAYEYKNYVEAKRYLRKC
ncbi:uncharacterized protein LOC106663613 [Cimex lectularius]|uniref:Uncharacterized protein n=1 Tax=Cimex lectularius TaxID=79782 RepID=A0A8I6RIQ0_CIMLE|nr:uncharacterized protein LOC106663613 [Cimex lectularius]